MERPLRLGFLASHGGTGFQYIHNAIDNGDLNAEIIAFISNNSKSEAMKYAQQIKGLKTVHLSSKTHEDPDLEIARIMMEQNADYIILSGYMKPLGGELVNPFEDRIINSHPADPKKYGGMYGDYVHEAVLKSGDNVTHPTIHLVDLGIDTGRILKQGVVDILKGETVETLREKVKTTECELLLGVIKELEPIT